MRRRVMQGAALALSGWLLAACSSAASPTLESVTTSPSPSTTSGASSSSSTATSAPTTTSPVFSSSTPTTDALSAAESADRAAAEAQYAKYWEVYAALPHTPESQWDSLLAAVAVEPMISNAKDDARSIIAAGSDTYGTVGHRFTWTGPIDGANTAVLQDCEDGSQAGAFETATGNKITVGVPRQTTMGTLVRGADGTWRLSAAYIVKDTPC